jgi:predicted dehydrogenase
VGVPGGTNVWGSRGALSDGKVFGEDGSSEAVMDRYRREAPAAQQAEDVPKGITDAFALEQLDWLRAIREGRQPRMTGEEGTVDLALSYAILESGLMGRAVTLEEMLKGEAEAYQREINEYYKL